MTYFAVTRERGPAWDASRSMREQDQWEAHAAFMDGLVEDGFVVLGGPIGGGEVNFLLIVDTDSAEAVEARLAEDPWSAMGLLTVSRIDRWGILLRA